MNKRVITPSDGEWPARLNELQPHPVPGRLHLEGRDLPNDPKVVAIVGTRRPTAAGVEATEQLARGLAEAGFAIVSGLAVGIDATAHRTALAAGARTIAVLGTGLDIDYPTRNAHLKDDIRRVGTLVSEYRDGTPPKPHHFPSRNRIVAGLAVGVVVVEGGLKSGALITARLAVDCNRAVWAVPGSVRNPNAAGPNELIRRGEAAVVTEVAHILEELAPGLVWGGEAHGSSPGPVALGDDERRVLDALDDVPLPLERLCMMSGMTPGRAALAVARLEVRGLAARRFGGYELAGAGGRLRAALRA